MSTWPILSLLVFLPVGGIAFLALTGRADAQNDRNARDVTLWTSLANLALAIVLAMRFDPGQEGFQFVEHEVRPHQAQQLHGRGDVVQVREIADEHRLVRQQGGCKNGKSSIFCAGDTDLAAQGYATQDGQFIHRARTMRR